MSRRLRSSARRGQFFQVPAQQIAAVAPAWIPQLIAAASRKPRAPLVIRQGVFFSAPRGQRVAHPGDVRQRKRLPTLRRGAFFAVPSTAVVVAQPITIVQVIQQSSVRSRYVANRRGSFFSAPRGQRMAHPGDVKQRKRLPRPRRGVFFTPPFSTAVVVPSTVIAQFIQQDSSRSRYVAIRRGSFLTSPLGQRMPHPGIMRRQKRALLLVRRGAVFPIYLLGAPPVITTRGVMSGVAGVGSTMSGVIGVGSTMSGV